jgi:SAM-dependent methyltransferase
MEENKLPSDFNTSTSANLLDQVCPNCLSKGMLLVYKLKNFPVHSILKISSKEEAMNFPRGNISLGMCESCGFISNIDFDPELLRYSPDCEESQGFSATYNEFAHRTAAHLIERYDLHRKNIIEIGCGKGEFLTLLCEMGDNHGVGFDPAYVPGRNEEKSDARMTFIQDFYSERYSHYQSDLICCRMTLEHIHDPANFLSMVRRSIGDHSDVVVFFQVPDVTRILSDSAFEDIYYEHCSYFSPGSLGRLFLKNSFELLDVKSVYNEQYIMLEARPLRGEAGNSDHYKNDLAAIKDYVVKFQKSYQSTVAFWRRQLDMIKAKGKKAVIWGSGSKGVSFLTTLGVYDEIQYVVDINPYRQGSYMAGTAQLVVAPNILREYKPDIVIIMNSIYQKEIQKDLTQMGLTPQIMTLSG